MPDPLTGLPPRFLRTPEAARFLGLSGRTLEKHLKDGTNVLAIEGHNASLNSHDFTLDPFLVIED